MYFHLKQKEKYILFISELKPTTLRFKDHRSLDLFLQVLVTFANTDGQFQGIELNEDGTTTEINGDLTRCILVVYSAVSCIVPKSNETHHEKTEAQTSFAVTYAQLISAFVFATRIVLFPFFLKAKF